MKVDYSMFRRHEVSEDALSGLDYDLLISSFDSTARVDRLFQEVSAIEKHWLVHAEYGYSPEELPDHDFVFTPPGLISEGAFWRDYFDASEVQERFRNGRVLIDITGMMRPHILLLPRLLKDCGWTRVDFAYSDPISYEEGHRTQFVDGAIDRVAQVGGFEGVHRPDAGEQDLLVIGVGYDDESVRRVADSKPAARKVQLFGLPSLQPHMYQESHLRAEKAEESLGPVGDRSLIFAPANNPFMTAQVVHDRVARERDGRGVSNLYLSPLGTKPQVLGFALYYMLECVDTATSILYPYSLRYRRATSTGFARTTIYELELDWAWVAEGEHP